ncbi:hypothetical protein L1987_13529 [Smallanthus sonchifolius]|uniref:Uncharacterized protein n=1 Tax=Smallanthus sonchifolius TaxID=185202 RepID=A0ACB9JH51_9ASTR|nr:hypothetical protein L1987_13529 [Smallanthus sonchifolius]
MPNSLSANSGLAKIQLLGHVVNEKGIHVYPSKVEAIKDQTTPITATEVRQLLGLAGCYRQFIEEISKYCSTSHYSNSKRKLCNAPILVFPEGTDDFVVYYNTSIRGLGCVLMQREKVAKDEGRYSHLYEQVSDLRKGQVLMPAHLASAQTLLPAHLASAQTSLLAHLASAHVPLPAHLASAQVPLPAHLASAQDLLCAHLASAHDLFLAKNPNFRIRV